MIYLCRQFDIGGGVPAGKRGDWGAVALGHERCCQAVVIPAGHLAGDRGAVVAGAAQVRQHHAALHLAALVVVKAFEHAADVFVAIEVTAAFCCCEVDFGSGCQKFLQLSAAFSRPC